MNVLVVEPMKAPYMKEIGDGLKPMQQVVGGSIQAVYPFKEQVALVCNEEGKMNGMPLNRALRDERGEIYDIIAGTLFIAGLGEEDFISLNNELAEQFIKRFEQPETFINMDGKIIAVPADSEIYGIKQTETKAAKKDKYIVDSNACIKAALTNLGKYNEGELVFKWISLPISEEELKTVLKEIGIDGKRYEEYFITDYDYEISGIYNVLGEYENLKELNALAERLDEMSEYEIDQYQAILEAFGTEGLTHLINLTYNLDCYDFLFDVNNDQDLGYYWVEESGCYDTENLGTLSNYIDYERFGRDIRLEENGDYVSGGYVYNNGNSFEEVYNRDDEPKPKPKPKNRDMCR